MDTILIFDTTIYGHHLEYVHHLYDAAADDAARRYVFVLPDEFEQVKGRFEWKAAGNVVFDLMNREQTVRCNHPRLLTAAWRKTRMLGGYVRKHHASRVMLIMLMLYVPFVLFLLPRGVKVSGIIYRIGLYRWRTMTWPRKAMEAARYLLMARMKSLEVAFVLGDSAAACVYNRRYGTDKFRPLPDPFAIPDYSPKNIRADLGLSPGQKVFLHFGAMTERKGTLTILEAARLIPEGQRREYAFVFAGKVKNDIRARFYEMVDELKRTTTVIVYDQFVPFETIADLCVSSDALLVPYANTMQSSGVIGYASRYNVPCIGPSGGLLGKIIRRYRLGIVADAASPRDMARAMTEADLGADVPPTYCEANTIKRFQTTIKTLCFEK